MKNSIDYQAPTHQLNDVLYDVETENIYTEIVHPQTKQVIKMPLSYYKVILNKSTGRIVSVVGHNYQLIKNREALQMGIETFLALYPRINPDDLIPYKVVAPASKASAHIDLIHKDVNFDVWDQETWLPFLRVSNSYNRTYALSFEIGFVRKLCSNGVLFNKNTIKLKYLHSDYKKINPVNDVQKIGKVFDIFKEQCNKLRKYEVPDKLIFPFVCHILKVNLNLPEKVNLKQKTDQIQRLFHHTGELSKHYSHGNKTDGYTLLNVVTDLVSHQEEYKTLVGYYLNVRSFYARPTDWMEEFTGKINHTNFNVNDYLIPTIIKLNEIVARLGINWQLN